MTGDTLQAVGDGSALGTTADGSALCIDGCCGDTSGTPPGDKAWFRLVACGDPRCIGDYPPAMWLQWPKAGPNALRRGETFKYLLRCYQWDGAAGVDEHPPGVFIAPTPDDGFTFGRIGVDRCGTAECNLNYCRGWALMTECGGGAGRVWVRTEQLSNPPSPTYMVRVGQRIFCACVSNQRFEGEVPNGPTGEVAGRHASCCACGEALNDSFPNQPCVIVTSDAGTKCCCTNATGIVVGGHAFFRSTQPGYEYTDDWNIVGTDGFESDGITSRVWVNLTWVHTDAGGVQRGTARVRMSVACGAAVDVEGPHEDYTPIGAPVGVTDIQIYLEGQLAPQATWPFEAGPCLWFRSVGIAPVFGLAHQEGTCYSYSGSETGEAGSGLNTFNGEFSYSLIYPPTSRCFGCTGTARNAALGAECSGCGGSLQRTEV